MNLLEPGHSDYRLRAGAYIRRLRVKRDLTREELALLIDGRGPELIAKIETGQIRAPHALWERLARTLRVDPETFARRLLAWYLPHLYGFFFGPPSGGQLCPRL